MGNVMENKATVKKVLNIVFYVVLAIVFIYAMFGLFSKKESNYMSFLGIASMSVQSDSMTGTFEEGDLVFIDTTFDAADLVEKEDVITFKTFEIIEGKTVYYYNTHRIDDIYESGGVLRFVTKGDKDGLGTDPIHLKEEDIIGVWTGKSISGFGKFTDGFTDFLKSGLGFFLFIVVPCLAFLVYEVVKFVKVYAAYNVQKSTQDRVKMQEEALAAARAQLEAEAKAKAEKEPKDQQE